MLQTLFFSHFPDRYGHPAPGRPSLYDLYWGKFQNQLYDDLYIPPLHYDAFHSIMTSLTLSYLRLETRYCTMMS